MRDTFLELNQANVIKLQSKHMGNNGVCKLTIEDFILIRRIGDFILSSKTVNVIVDNIVYHWVKYESIYEDLPMVFPSVLALKKRVEKLSTLGILVNKKYNVKKSEVSEDGFENPGTYSVIKLSKDTKKLFDIPEEKKQPKVAESHEGYYPVGSKGYHPVGSNPCHPVGGNKEYLEIEYQEKNTTTTKKDDLNEIEHESEQTEKNSSSSSDEVREIKKTLAESGLEIQTCKNIMNLVRENKIDLSRIKEVLTYAKTKSWEDGAVYKALAENWNAKEFKPHGSKAEAKRTSRASTFSKEAKKQADEDFAKTLEERVPTAEEIERAKELCRLNGIFAPKMPTVLARTYLKQFGEWRD